MQLLGSFPIATALSVLKPHLHGRLQNYLKVWDTTGLATLITHVQKLQTDSLASTAACKPSLTTKSVCHDLMIAHRLLNQNAIFF